jgi:antitoxin component YwqK of YwqJK toxin-antitoxin module
MRKLSVLVSLIVLSSCTQSINAKLEKDNIKLMKDALYYKGIPFTGELFNYHENGQLKIKNNYKNGKIVD